MRLDNDLYVLPERHQEPQQPLNRELPEVTAQHLGNVGLLDPEQLGGLNLLEPALLHQGVDLVDELRLDQVFLGIGKAEISEDIPAPHFVSIFFFVMVAHLFTMRSASRNGRLISSISALGVSRPF
jgi:hypothetical protein